MSPCKAVFSLVRVGVITLARGTLNSHYYIDLRMSLVTNLPWPPWAARHR